MNKAEIRKTFQTIRKNITTENKNKYSEIITEKLKNTIKTYSRKNTTLTICIFAGTKHEPNITPLLSFFEQEIKEKKIAFYFPKCDINNTNTTNTMDFYSVETIADLEYIHPTFHILEPNKNCKILDIYKTQIDIFIIPAVSIDEKNNRIGMGAGFYDRYFHKYFAIHEKKKSTILCTLFSAQISRTLFTKYIDTFDIPADTVVTEL